MPQLVGDVNVCAHRVETSRRLGAGTVTLRELALGGVARIPGGVGTGSRAVDAAVLGENKEWKEGEEQKRPGQHPVVVFSLNNLGAPLEGRGCLVAVGGREPGCSRVGRNLFLLLLGLFAGRSHAGSLPRGSNYWNHPWSSANPLEWLIALLVALLAMIFNHLNGASRMDETTAASWRSFTVLHASEVSTDRTWPFSSHDSPQSEVNPPGRSSLALWLRNAHDPPIIVNGRFRSRHAEA